MANGLDNLIVGLFPAEELSDEGLEDLVVVRVIHGFIDCIFGTLSYAGVPWSAFLVLVLGFILNVVQLIAELVQFLAGAPVHINFHYKRSNSRGLKFIL